VRLDLRCLPALGLGGDDGHALTLRELLLDLGEVFADDDGVDLRSFRVFVGQNDELVRACLGKPRSDGTPRGLVSLPIRDDARSKRRQERKVARQDAELPLDAGGCDLIDADGKCATARSDDLELYLVGH
jgi:hypothetical protein